VLLGVTNSQFNFFTCGICLNDSTFNNPTISNNLFITEPNATAIKLAGSVGIMIFGNTIAGVTTVGTTGIWFTGGYATGGVIANNNIGGFATALKIDAAVNTAVYFQNNRTTDNTTEYSIGAGAGVIILDFQPRNYATAPTCNAGIIWSQFVIADPNPGPVYKGNVTAGGGALNPTQVVCDGSVYKAH
jgi:hypothetical protein